MLPKFVQFRAVSQEKFCAVPPDVERELSPRGDNQDSCHTIKSDIRRACVLSSAMADCELPVVSFDRFDLRSD